VLEHLPQPEEALRALRRVLRPGGTITAIEGDHGFAQFHPDSADAHDAIDCLVELQRMRGGDALIGRRLFPLMKSAGLDAVKVAPRMVYVDASLPDRVEGFTEKTFIAMIEGARLAAIDAGLTTADAFDSGIDALRRTTAPDGVFCYTFFKGTAVEPSA
jgi:SAM-dependent methyltransferase